MEKLKINNFFLNKQNESSGDTTTSSKGKVEDYETKVVIIRFLLYHLGYGQVL